MRHESPIPVTGNWNSALKRRPETPSCSGDDVALSPARLGDFRIGRTFRSGCDLCQCLEPRSSRGPTRHARWRPSAGYGSYSPISPYVLGREAAIDLVRRAAPFEMATTLNMQHSFVYRRLVTDLSTDGPFFRSPYPDFYATNAIFLAARRLVIEPARLVMIRLSPRSFGAYVSRGARRKASAPRQ